MSDVQIITGDCIESMRAMPADSVHTCVTSPPYFGLRDYGHDGQIGLEPTPDEFVAALRLGVSEVEFRFERVLARHDPGALEGQAAILDELQDCVRDHFGVEHTTFQEEPDTHPEHEHPTHP